MKVIFVLVALLVSVAAYADVTCDVSVFGHTITGSGRSVNAASVDARIKCMQAGNNEMFCRMDKMTCATETFVPMSYCELIVMSDYFYSIQPSQQMAADVVHKDCLAKQNDMFCKADRMKCLDL